jgi:hypothetical protein
MLRDAEPEMKRIIDFFDLPFDRRTLRGAIEYCTLEHMQKIEKRYGNLDDPAERIAALPANLRFVRSGKAGSHREAFSPGDLQALNRYFSAHLTDVFGYDLRPEAA